MVADRASHPHQGFEASLRLRPSPRWSLFGTYSYQEDPEVEGIPEEEINQPPHIRLNLGASWAGAKYLANGNVNYVDETFRTDVLDSRFRGATDNYFQVNLALGVRLAGERMTLALNGQNVFDERVQQHVFGDVISRKITAEVLFRFPG